MRTMMLAAAMMLTACGGTGEFTPAGVEPVEDQAMVCGKCLDQSKGLVDEGVYEDAGACAAARAWATSTGRDAAACGP